MTSADLSEGCVFPVVARIAGPGAVVAPVPPPTPVITAVDPCTVTVEVGCIPGPAGPPGPAGASYEHHQSVASDVWIVSHDLGFNPNVTVIDSAGEVVEGEISYLSGVSLLLTFSAAFVGVAYLS